MDGADQVIGELVGERVCEAILQARSQSAHGNHDQNLIKGFEVSINELEWMTPETKVAAQENCLSLPTRLVIQTSGKTTQR